MIHLEDAQRTVLEQCHRLAPVSVPLAEAIGRVLADDVVASQDVPPFDNSAVDGFAVLAADLAAPPVELRIVGGVAAGAAWTSTLTTGQTIRIMTGAPVPAGADAVVMVEDSELLSGDRVRLAAAVSAGAAIRRAGSDIRRGDTALRAGTLVTPAVLGTLASLNAAQLDVVPPARVAVLATGDELVTDGRDLAPGQIRESNLVMLEALLVAAGCAVTNLGVVPDDAAMLESVFAEAAPGHDAIVTSGGVSMGDFDVVKEVLGRIADMRWMQIAMKPAKPFAFGLLGGTPIFGLPGNPVSALVSFEMLARPCLRKMMGHARWMRPSVVAISDDGVSRRVDGKVHLDRVRGRFDDDGRYHVRGVGRQGSHQLAASALADAIAVIPDGHGVAPGDEVAVLLLRD